MSSVINLLKHSGCYIPYGVALKTLNFYTHTHYTGCNRRNGPDFGREFLMLSYTEKPQLAIENCGLPSGPRTIAVSWDSYILVGQQ